MRCVNKAIHMINEITKYIMIALLAIMVASMFYQVVTRYALGTGIPWTEEVARFANVWLIFLGASVVAFKDDHIKVTIFDSILKEKGLYILKTIRSLIFLTYSIIVIKIGFDSLSIVSSQTSPNLLLSMNYIYLAIPIGAILTAIYLIVIFVNRKKEENNG